MRVRPALFATLLLAAACTTGDVTSPGGAHGAAPELDDLLILRAPDGTLTVGSASGLVLSSGHDRVTAPDGSALYRTRRHGAGTVLEVRDASTGDLVNATRLPGRLEVLTGSPSGRSVAMMPPLPAGIEPTESWFPRTRSTVVVVDPSGARRTRRYALRGNYEPEAFSIDDSRLFLIQYLPAAAPTSYRVTSLDLSSGVVRPVFGRFASPPERMPGVRLGQVFDPASEQLFTLYTNRAAAHFHDGWEAEPPGGREVSFVHVLNLRAGWAYCAGLPRSLWGHPRDTQAMATSPDGRSLYVVDSIRGLVAEMDTRSLTIVRTSRVDLPAFAGGPTSASTSEDGGDLFVAVGGTTITRIDVETLTTEVDWTLSGDVGSLALSEDGARLFASLGDRVEVLDPRNGERIASLPFGPVESILSVATP
jgi:WD40 repeat protein